MIAELRGMSNFPTIKMAKHIDKLKASNNIFYILELNNLTEKEVKDIFNKVLKMRKNKSEGKFF